MSSVDSIVPICAEEITIQWLQRALELKFPQNKVSQANLTPIGVGYGLASTLYRCELDAQSAPKSLIAKLWDTEGFGGTSEVGFYKHVGSKLSSSIPCCYYGAIDQEQHRGVLLLEDIAHARQGNCTERASLEDASKLAVTLAEIHAAHWAASALSDWEWLSQSRDINRTNEWHEPRAEKIQQLYGELFDSFSQELLAIAPQVAERGNALLKQSYQTLVHGDLHLDNVLFDDQNDKIYLLDWASVVRGSPAIDLQMLLFDIGPLEHFDQLFEIYVAKVRELGVKLNEAQLIIELEGVLLRNFIRHTCGLANWHKPVGRSLKIVRTSIERVVLAVHHWHERNSALFNFGGPV